MIIIGEKINSTLKAIRPAMEARDTAAIQDLALRQAKAGANFIDVNAGMFLEDEPEKLTWLVESVQAVTKTPLCIDSPNPKAVLAGLKANKNPRPLINSITDEKERFAAILPLIGEFSTGIIALCMDDSGMPETVEDRLRVADSLVGKLTREGVALGDIYLDPIIRPVGTGPHYGVVAIETIRRIKENYPQAHIACGLSNVSFGLPARKLVNQAMLVAAMAAGMDGAILDPLDKKLMSFVYATEALLGIDEYCVEYLGQYREGNIEA